jgi:hypothetical protein
MKSNKNNQIKNHKVNNLIGESSHRNYLKIQSTFGFSQRGGVQFPFAILKHSKRLVSDINILTSSENKYLVFSESIFSN